MDQQQQPPIEEDYSSESGGLLSRLSSWMVTLVVCSTSAFLTAGLISSFFSETYQNSNSNDSSISHEVGISYKLPDRKKAHYVYLPDNQTSHDSPFMEEETLPPRDVVADNLIEQEPHLQETITQNFEQQENFAQLDNFTEPESFEKQEPQIEETFTQSFEQKRADIKQALAAKPSKPKKYGKKIPAQNFLGNQTKQLINKAYATSSPLAAETMTTAEMSPLIMEYRLRNIPTQLHKTSNRNLMAQRVEAGEKLMSRPGNSYSIQIMRVSKATIGNVDNFINNLGLAYMTDDLYMFPVNDQQYLIYYGSFDRAKTARKALAKLPDAIQKSGAFIIPLQRIKAKIVKQKLQRQIVKYRQNIS
ncbi:MAG: hypothetical protein HQL69_10665 [Magnetococcales bacterium]|nr:hypothetical protein [Magnetococcales bacterium]